MIKMAIVKEIESPSGVKMEKGYHKIIEGKMKWIEAKRRWYMLYTVGHFFDRTARRLDKPPVFFSNFIMKINLTDHADGNPIFQAYEHLKSQEGYEGASDL